MSSKEQLEMRHGGKESQDRINPGEVQSSHNVTKQPLTQPSLSFFVRTSYFTTTFVIRRYPVPGTMLRNFVT